MCLVRAQTPIRFGVDPACLRYRHLHRQPKRNPTKTYTYISSHIYIFSIHALFNSKGFFLLITALSAGICSLSLSVLTYEMLMLYMVILLGILQMYIFIYMGLLWGDWFWVHASFLDLFCYHLCIYFSFSFKGLWRRWGIMLNLPFICKISTFVLYIYNGFP